MSGSGDQGIKLAVPPAGPQSPAGFQPPELPQLQSPQSSPGPSPHTVPQAPGAMSLLRAPLLTLALLALAQAFSLDVPSSDEAHQHHDHGHLDHAEHHAHHGHAHEEEREGKASALEGLDTVISDIFPDTLEAAGSLAAAVARGGVDFSGAAVITGEDGVAKSCVEKEETRQEYR